MSKPRGKQVASDIRGAFIRAAKSLEGKGKPLSTMWEESLQNDFLGTMRALQGFIPKEHMIGGDEENPLKTVNEVKVTFVHAESEPT